MKFIFEILTSPFGLPINPVYEYILLAGIGLIAFRIAYDLAGMLGGDSFERKGLHWFIRLLVFIVLWAIARGVIWVVQNQLLAFIIAGIIVGLIVIIWIIRIIISFSKRKKRERED